MIATARSINVYAAKELEFQIRAIGSRCRRQLSSAVAAATCEPLPQPGLPTPISGTSTATNPGRVPRTPEVSRLEELRKKLSKDAPELSIYKTLPSKTSKVVPEEKKKEQLSLHELLQQLPPLPVSTPILTDTFNRPHSYLRISLTERCNLRCQYCMPPEGVPLSPEANLLQRDEIFKLASLFGKHGVDKIRLTGGEPLLRKNLKEIISDLRSVPSIHQIGMTTNGMTLTRQLDDLIAAGLTHVNISLDTLHESKFRKLTRRPGLDRVLQSIRAAAAAFPQGRVKINCVVVRNTNHDELVDFCNLTRELPVDVRFIEWMPFLDNGWSLQDGLVPYQEMLDIIQSSSQGDNFTLQRVDDGPNDTTKWWRIAEGGLGRIGFITSMSNHFCGTCNRLRITADGQIKVCLFGSSN
ncbi:GTP 3' [Fragilaria crotonensis]|nr:GTP 3' [Fragilaria crotonensis]